MQLPTDTSTDEGRRHASVAVLPVGSFEQHGQFLPLATDTIVACSIAQTVSDAYGLFLLPPITVSCSHEHHDFPGTVSISAATLHRTITDIAASLASAGIRHLAVVNGHGGNYVLSNVVQEANVAERRMTLFPSRDDWSGARIDAGLTTDAHEDMHGGELETSFLLHVAPELVRPGYDSSDWTADTRPHLLLLGMHGYTTSGVIGRPSLATAGKGRALLDSLTTRFKDHLNLLVEHPA